MNQQTCHCSLYFAGEAPGGVQVPFHLVQSFDHRDDSHIKSRGGYWGLSAGVVFVGGGEIACHCFVRNDYRPVPAQDPFD